MNAVSKMSLDRMSSRQAEPVVDLDGAVLEADDDVVGVALDVENFALPVPGMDCPEIGQN